MRFLNILGSILGRHFPLKSLPRGGRVKHHPTFFDFHVFSPRGGTPCSNFNDFSLIFCPIWEDIGTMLDGFPRFFYIFYWNIFHVIVNVWIFLVLFWMYFAWVLLEIGCPSFLQTIPASKHYLIKLSFKLTGCFTILKPSFQKHFSSMFWYFSFDAATPCWAL